MNRKPFKYESYENVHYENVSYDHVDMPVDNKENQSAATNLIEEIERQTGNRIDANDYNNNGMTMLLGAMAGILEGTRTSYRDDYARGVVAQYHLSAEYKQKQIADQMLGDLLMNGFAPDDICSIKNALS
jgi:hypothetical protein